MHSKLKIREISSVLDAEDIRQIRNSGMRFMTHNNMFITSEQQVNWFVNTYRPARSKFDLIAFLGTARKSPVAYGMISKRPDKYWLSGVISDGYRGSGYGEQLFRHMIEFIFFFAERVWLDVFQNNEPAIHLYKKLGFLEMERTNGIIIMYLDKADYEV